MHGQSLIDDAPGRQLVLDLFTEIAILEHLIRKRFEPLDTGKLTSAQFGVINFFCRLGKSEERVSSLAWSFQVEDAAMHEIVVALKARDLVTLDAASDPCVRITQAGRTLHTDTVSHLAPEIAPLLEEFDVDDLRTTTRTLIELRRTLDNLPDR